MMDHRSAFSDSRFECSRQAFVRVLPPRLHTVAVLTGGLRRLLSRLKERQQPVKHGEGAFTDSHGRFQPPEGMLLASRYRVADIICCRGQSAVLVRAHDIVRGDMTVVIKALHDKDIYFDIGYQEAHTLRRLACADPHSFSHTVKLLNTFLYDHHFCLVFEALDPKPVTHVLSGLHFGHDQLLQALRKVALQLLQVLGFLRQNNTIHADLKPENILLRSVRDLNSLRVIDFGNAINHVHREMSLYYKDFEVQTLLYRAPEVLYGIPFGAEIDMWSVGCILAEIYLGQPLIHGPSKRAIIQSMVDVLGPLPRQVFCRGKFFDQLDQFTQKSPSGDHTTMRLMKRFQERFQPDYAFTSFLAGMLTYDPDKRFTPTQAARHPFLAPEVCLSYLLPASDTKDCPTSTVFVSSEEYSKSPDISSDIRRQHPTSFDLLRIGTGTAADSSGEATPKPSPSLIGHRTKPTPSTSEHRKRSTKMSTGKRSADNTPLSLQKSPDTTFYIEQTWEINKESPLPESPLPTTHDEKYNSLERLAKRLKLVVPSGREQNRQSCENLNVSSSPQDIPGEHTLPHHSGSADTGITVLRKDPARSMKGRSERQLSASGRIVCDIWPLEDRATRQVQGHRDSGQVLITDSLSGDLDSQCHASANPGQFGVHSELLDRHSQGSHPQRHTQNSDQSCHTQTSDTFVIQTDTLISSTECEGVSSDRGLVSPHGHGTHHSAADVSSNCHDQHTVDKRKEPCPWETSECSPPGHSSSRPTRIRPNETFTVVEVETSEDSVATQSFFPHTATSAVSRVIRHVPASQRTNASQDRKMAAGISSDAKLAGTRKRDQPTHTYESSSSSCRNIIPAGRFLMSSDVGVKSGFSRTHSEDNSDGLQVSCISERVFAGSRTERDRYTEPVDPVSTGRVMSDMRNDGLDCGQSRPAATSTRHVTVGHEEAELSVESVNHGQQRQLSVDLVTQNSKRCEESQGAVCNTSVLDCSDHGSHCGDHGNDCGDHGNDCGDHGNACSDHGNKIYTRSSQEREVERHNVGLDDVSFDSESSERSNSPELRGLISTLASETPCVSRPSSRNERLGLSLASFQGVIRTRAQLDTSDVTDNGNISELKSGTNSPHDEVKRVDVRRASEKKSYSRGSQQRAFSCRRKVSPRTAKSKAAELLKGERNMMVQRLQYLSPSSDTSPARTASIQHAPKAVVSSLSKTQRRPSPKTARTSSTRSKRKISAAQQKQAFSTHAGGKQPGPSPPTVKKKLSFPKRSPGRRTPQNRQTDRKLVTEDTQFESVRVKLEPGTCPAERHYHQVSSSPAAKHRRLGSGEQPSTPGGLGQGRIPTPLHSNKKSVPQKRSMERDAGRRSEDYGCLVRAGVTTTQGARRSQGGSSDTRRTTSRLRHGDPSPVGQRCQMTSTCVGNHDIVLQGNTSDDEVVLLL